MCASFALLTKTNTTIWTFDVGVVSFEQSLWQFTVSVLCACVWNGQPNICHLVNEGEREENFWSEKSRLDWNRCERKENQLTGESKKPNVQAIFSVPRICSTQSAERIRSWNCFYGAVMENESECGECKIHERLFIFFSLVLSLIPLVSARLLHQCAGDLCVFDIWQGLVSV